MKRSQYIYLLCPLLLMLLSTSIYCQISESERSQRELMTELLTERIKDLPGHSLPLTTLESFDGHEYDMQNLLGKPTVIMIWGIGCQPCLDQMKVLDSIYQIYAPAANIISITSNVRMEAEPFIMQRELSSPQFVNANLYINEALDAKFLPKILLVDSGGMVLEVLSRQNLDQLPEKVIRFINGDW